MGKLSKEMAVESIEHYRELVDNFEKLSVENKKQMVDPRTSESKRHAYKILVEVCEKEKRECQKAIKRLLNE